MEEIIKKAIEGGYKWTDPHEDGSYQEIVCDPFFWQALGKACGWENCCGNCGGYLMKDGHCGESSDCWIATFIRPKWQFVSLHFHEINLIEGWDKAVEYLENLIK